MLVRTEQEAIAAGYIKPVFIETANGMVEFNALVKADAELDSEFLCFDIDSRELLKVYGWLCLNIEELPETVH